MAVRGTRLHAVLSAGRRPLARTRAPVATVDAVFDDPKLPAEALALILSKLSCAEIERFRAPNAHVRELMGTAGFWRLVERLKDLPAEPTDVQLGLSQREAFMQKCRTREALIAGLLARLQTALRDYNYNAEPYTRERYNMVTQWDAAFDAVAEAREQGVEALVARQLDPALMGRLLRVMADYDPPTPEQQGRRLRLVIGLVMNGARIESTQYAHIFARRLFFGQLPTTLTLEQRALIVVRFADAGMNSSQPTLLKRGAAAVEDAVRAAVLNGPDDSLLLRAVASLAITDEVDNYPTDILPREFPAVLQRLRSTFTNGAQLADTLADRVVAAAEVEAERAAERLREMGVQESHLRGGI